MHPDTLSVILRGASFIALFQAAGMVLFVAMFGRQLERSLSALQRITKLSAILAAAFVVGQYACGVRIANHAAAGVSNRPRQCGFQAYLAN